MQQVDEFIRHAQHLPPSPVILLKLVPLLSQPDSDTNKVVELISYDQSLTASIVRVSNSAYYGAAGRISNLGEAVIRLGFSEIYRLVAAVLGARTMTGVKGFGIDSNEMWKNSVTTALAAQLLAHDQNDDEHAAFTAGLMHDIGIVILSESLRSRYADLIEEVHANSWSLLETERKRLGVDHADIGARLLQHWGFDASFVTAVRHHHRPIDAQSHERLASYIYLGNMIANFMGHCYSGLAFSPRGREQALSILSINAQQLPSYVARTFEHFGAIESVIETT